MNLNHKREMIANGFFISILGGQCLSRKRRFKCASRFAPSSVRVLVTAAMLLVLGQPLFAQEPVHTEATNAAVVSGSHPSSSGADSGEIARSTSETGKDSTADGTPAASGTGTIYGTVVDVNGDLVPGATVVLNSSSPDDRREVTADDGAAFKFDSVKPGKPYEVIVQMKGYSDWTSSSIVLEPSQFLILTDIHLRMEVEATSVTVYASSEEVAVEQIRLEEQQRVLGFIPNFYVNYDGSNAAPLTAKLKFKLAMKVATDPVTIMGVGFMSGIDQAANTPNYVQGAKGFGQRFGANAAGEFSDILIGGAILPSLLHQDPRYFYQGTGGTRSRITHAVTAPFTCRGDNGHREINFSSMGGVVGATALSMTYYPKSNRGTGDFFVAFGVSEVERMIAAIAQEFIIPRFTPSLKRSRQE